MIDYFKKTLNFSPKVLKTSLMQTIYQLKTSVFVVRCKI